MAVMLLAFSLACKPSNQNTAQPHNQNTTPSNTRPTTDKDIELIKRLTNCIDYNYIAVDSRCVQNDFTPLLGLSNTGKIMYIQFGDNTDERFILLNIRQSSRSGKTVGWFEISFGVERHVFDQQGLYQVPFWVGHGQTYGTLTNDHFSPVGIYDMGHSDYLANNQQGEVVDSSELSIDKQWSSEHRSSNLINSGKTIGDILAEHLEKIEATGQGIDYSEKGESRYQYFKRVDRDRNITRFSLSPAVR